MMEFGRYGGGRGMFGFGGMFLGLLCLIFFIAVIVWIIRMVTWRRHGMSCGMHGMHGMHGMYGMYDDHGPMHGMQDEALAILRKRFAGGDITKEEYDERLKVLNREK